MFFFNINVSSYAFKNEQINMYRSLSEIVILLGAFFCWMFKGFKGTFDNQYDDKYFNENLGVGIISTFILITSTAIIATLC